MRKLFYWLLISFAVLRIVIAVTRGVYSGAVWPILTIIALTVAIRLINRVLLRGSSTSEELVSDEKPVILITTLINPIIAGAFYYYSWKKDFPVKARQANKYSFMTFVLFLIIGIVLIGFGLIQGPH